MADLLHIINEESVRLQIKRGDVCSLLIALDSVADATNGKKWPRIRDLIREQLDKHDERQKEQGNR